MPDKLRSVSRTARGGRLLAACLLAVCCGKTEEPKTPLPPEAQQFCDAWEKAVVDWCAWSSNCCADLSYANYLCRPSQNESCADTIRAFGLDHGATWGTSATACLAAVSGEAPTAECTGPIRAPWSIGYNALSQVPECKRLLVGTLASGAQCGSDFECSGSLVCQYERAESRLYCGPLAGEGRECTYDSDCAEGLVCGADYLCHSGDVGDPCEDDMSCQWPLVCSSTSFDGVCRAPGNEGDSCSQHSSEACRSDLLCSDPQGGVCVPRRANGEACTSDDECRGACDLQNSVCVDLCGGPNSYVQNATSGGVSGVGGNAGSSGQGGAGPNGGAGAGGAAGSGGVAGAGGTGGVGGAGGATGGGGAGGSDVGVQYCDTRQPESLPYEIMDLVNNFSPNRVPESANSELTPGDCPVPIGAPYVPEDCQLYTYEQIDPGNTFASLQFSWPAGDLPPCFAGVSALDFWVMGTDGAVVTFNAFGADQIVTLSSTWTAYSIPIAVDLNTSGVTTAFTVTFIAANGTGPYDIQIADAMFVE